MWRALTLAIVIGLGMMNLGGCAGQQGSGLRSHFVEFSPVQEDQYAAASPGVYTIQAGDKLTVHNTFIDGLPNSRVLVLPDGSVSLPEVDRIVLQGLTVERADSLITSLYARTYQDPSITVIVEEPIGRQVYVLGEVNNPGLHPVPFGGIGILNAIGAAGGFTENAKRENTVLVRMNEDGYLCQEVDLSQFYAVDAVNLVGVNVDTYDVIYVPRSRVGDFAYFSANVLGGALNITRILSDVRYIVRGNNWR